MAVLYEVLVPKISDLGHYTYIDGAYSIIGTPPHVGKRESALPKQITWFGQTSEMR